MIRYFFFIAALFVVLWSVPALAGDEGSGEDTREPESQGPTQDLFGGLLDDTPQGWVVDGLAHDQANEAREAAEELDQSLTPEAPKSEE